MVDQNEKQENPGSEPSQSTGNGNSEKILEDYLKPKRLQPRFWIWVGLTIVAIIMVLVYKITVVDTTISQEELKSSVELFNLDSQWVEKEKIDTEEFKGIVLVPQFSFHVRNVGKVDLHNIYFLGVFRLMDRAKALGEGFEMTLKKPLKPGQESERIVLTCQFGYRASSKMAFKNNSKEWRTAMVQVFTKTGASKLLLLNTFYISRKIEGLEVDITLTDKSADELIGEKSEPKKEDIKK